MPATSWPPATSIPVATARPTGVSWPTFTPWPTEAIVAQTNWFRFNNGQFVPYTDANGVPYFRHLGHVEVWVATTASFGGSFTIYVNPYSPNSDAPNETALGIWLDGVFNQTVTCNTTSGYNRTQALVVNTGVRGAHTIRIQEGDAAQGVSIVSLAIAGTVIPAPAVVRQYSVFGDSVSEGAMAVPRSTGWAVSMRAGTRFDGVTLLGQSGLALGTIAQNAGLRTSNAAFAIQSLIGTTENVLCLCLSINDWVTSAQSLSAATYESYLGLFVTACKAAAVTAGTPGFKIMLHSMTHIFGGLPGAANDKGATPAAINAAIQNVAAANPVECVYLDVFNACPDADMADSFDHPNATGMGKIYTVVAAGT